MAEVAVAFPSDETSAEVVASRLRAEGIATRVDRGLAGSSWQVTSRGHVTVFVDERVAEQAHRILGTKHREESPPGPFVRLAVALLVLALVVGVGAIAVTVIRP
jgi:hypothetical protein